MHAFSFTSPYPNSIMIIIVLVATAGAAGGGNGGGVVAVVVVIMVEAVAVTFIALQLLIHAIVFGQFLSFGIS